MKDVVPLTNKEHVVYFMLQGKIKLSEYDKSFLKNIHNSLYESNTITSNQLNLLELIIHKYKRQLKTNGYDSTNLLKLPNTFNVIESLDEYKYARVTLVDDLLNIKAPFNEKFISFAKSEYISWNRATRTYQVKFSSASLRLLYISLEKYFEKAVYCNNLCHLIENLDDLSKYNWSPRLVKLNNNLYIIGANEVLMDQLKDFTLNENNQTFSKLARLGVTIDPSLITTDENIFNSHMNVSFGVEDAIENLATYMKNSEYNKVYFYAIKQSVVKEFMPSLNEAGIKVLLNFANREVVDETILITENSKDVLSLFSKRVLIRDTRPIKLT